MKRHSQKPSAGEFGETEMRRWWKEKDCLLNITEKILTESMDRDYIVNLVLNDIT